jgi:putative phosphoserine phosphatase / 1-acylglycerol-3-phosphate O-acyltransferase
VFPPIPVEDWTLDNLNDRIAEVRQLYLDTLRDWPVGGLPQTALYTGVAEQAAARKPAGKRPSAKNSGSTKNAGRS